MTLQFGGQIWYWRGPAPHYFVTVPEDLSRDLMSIVESVTYGWGMIPASITLNESVWTTALFPKDGRYIVPLKAVVRKAENLEEGDHVTVRIEVR